MFRHVVLLTVFLCALSLAGAAGEERPFVDKAIQRQTAQSLIEAYGTAQEARIRQGVTQVAERWWLEDGDSGSFTRFCTEQFVADDAALAAMFSRLQEVVEQIDGHLHEVRRVIRTPADLDTGPVNAVDELLGAVDLAAHVDEDLFASKVAFLALLNFPVHTLADRLSSADGWDRGTWARSRMMDRFALRVPATVSLDMTAAFTRADQYVAAYNIRMDRLVTPAGERPFPEGLRLITHWGLRDELKSQYAEGTAGLERQRMILHLMERIVRQEIPEAIIDNAELLWSPETNDAWTYRASGLGEPLELTREPDTRYRHLLDVFHAVRGADPYAPTAPTYIDRRFELDREIPEEQVERLLVSVVGSKEFSDLGALISKRLGRPLEPFDIWYNGFTSRGDQSQSDLDAAVAKRYPDVESFQRDLPRILTELGFSKERAAWLSARIVVDPSRGAGHAMGAVRREDQAHLRTRFGPDGMDYKGYNIAVHELGHNVEQVLSLNEMDHWWLNGVPNTAFTEALAFVFQNRDLELLGLDSPGADARHMEALDTLWSTAEIGGVALVDMGVWRWMYANPDAKPAELREATLRIAREVWNRYFAPVFGVEDQEILAIYSHMIVYGLYLPDYPLGHIIAFQVAEKLREGDFGASFERVAVQGRLTPDAWMRGAVGRPLSSDALLAEAKEALKAGTN
jgi:hypothetical protein